MKRFSVILSLLVVLALIMSIVSCSQTPAATTTAPTTQAPPPTTSSAPATSAPAPTTSKPPTTTAPATTTAPTTPAASTVSTAKYVLSMAPCNVPQPAPDGSNPPPAGASLFYRKYIELITAKTNGQVKIEPYWAQTLVPVNQIINGVSTGIADIGGEAQDKEAGKLPLSMVAMQPGFGTDWWAQSMAFWDLLNQEPLLSEYGKYGILPLSPVFIPDYNLIATKPIRTLADLKGKKISASGMQAQTLTLLGAVPIAMSPTEQYEGMQKGTIDGNTASYSPIADFKFYEVAKYITLFPFGGKMQLQLISKNSWNKLPADIQAIFKAVIPDSIQANINCFFVKDQPMFPMSPELVKTNNLELIKPSAEDIAALRQIQGKMADQWAVDTDKAGMPGTKVLTDYRALIAKYEKISTFAFK
jgi:TRAP-type C4-dicarboxylate transport system substrate-binding protein